ncbi:MAG: TnpV protein [Clostridia bacterium]|nr:TnpV protein [Clostridia bacterium]MBR0414965.1 TnpV protein [Clostridia bacterium]
MKPTYTDKNTGISYTLVGNIYLPNLVLPHCDYSIGLWGQRYLEHIKAHRKGFYTALKMQCKLDKHLQEVDTRAYEMYESLVASFAKKKGITEALKAEDMMAWVAAMNNIANRAREIVWDEIIGGGCVK